MINKIEIMSKKGVGKILVWIIIILVVLAVIFILYEYVYSDDSSEGDGQTDEGSLTGEESTPPTIQEYVNEKPPRPPE